MKWSAEDDAKLTMLWDKGLSATQISSGFDGQYSRCSVISRAHRIKLPARGSTANRHLGGRTVSPPKQKKFFTAAAPVEEPPVIGEPGLFPDKGCTWIGGDTGPAFRCCGQPRHERYPFCLHHASRAYAKPNSSGQN